MSDVREVKIRGVEAISTVSVHKLLVDSAGRIAEGVTACEQQCATSEDLKPVHQVTPESLPLRPCQYRHGALTVDKILPGAVKIDSHEHDSGLVFTEEGVKTVSIEISNAADRNFLLGDPPEKAYKCPTTEAGPFFMKDRSE